MSAFVSVRCVAPMVLAATLAACGSVPVRKLPQAQLQDTWSSAPAELAGSETTAPAWWNNFHDPVLDQLIELAQDRNLDLRLAEARIREARAQRNTTHANLLPQIDGSVQVERGVDSRDIATDTASVGGIAIVSLVMLAAIGFALHSLLKGELERHQATELNTRSEVNQPLIMKVTEPSRWESVHDKFDAMTPQDGRTRYWVLSDDPHYRYGLPLPDGRYTLERPDGFGELAIPGKQHPMKTLVRSVAGNGERPPVRLMIAIDSTPFVETLRAFTVGLMVLTIVGALLVALLGYYIARVGLRPLDRVSREAQALTPERLSQRLPLSKLPPELSRLTASFNGALDRLESAYQQLEAFNADVAHELRTPLANLIGQTQVALSRERSGAELKEVLHSNLEELDRLRGIVNDMLFLARADRGETALDRAEVSLAREIHRTVEFLEVVLEEAGVRVRIEGDVPASIQLALFQRAVINLIQNAVEHSPRGAQIVVTIAQQRDAVRICVQNPGDAIPREHLPRLFDRFYRVDQARSSSGGNHGLGLAIVKAVATMHGGSVFAENGEMCTMIGFTVATLEQPGSTNSPDATAVRSPARQSLERVDPAIDANVLGP